MNAARLLTFLAVSFLALPAGAQPDRAMGERPETVEMRRRLIGALVHARVSVELADVSVREAVDALRPQIPAPLVVRYADDPVGYGIDPGTRITLEHTDEVALTVLEDLLGQCSGTQRCTWQLRRGFVELGTRERLSVPAARERRVYTLGDLIIDVPDDMAFRKHRAELAIGIVGDIVESVEPDLWDWGQLDQDAPPTRNATLDAADASTATPDRPSPRYVPARRAAVIRYWRNMLIVDAPDFMHRQINGYPAPIPPSPEALTPGFVWTVNESDQRWRASDAPRAWEHADPDDASP